MKSRSTGPDDTRFDDATLDEAGIDARYGLEPVIDVEGGEQTPFSTVQCPYCGEPFETTIDTSAGSTSYIEDCQVCCQPIEMTLKVNLDGAMTSLTAARTD
jgi:Cysteine-rich CPXCG